MFKLSIFLLLIVSLFFTACNDEDKEIKIGFVATREQYEPAEKLRYFPWPADWNANSIAAEFPHL